MTNIKFKIENGVLYYSTDNECTWTNIGLVKGDKGDTGETGATGATGATGLNGLDGVDGTNGTNGTNGISLSMKATQAECTNINDAYFDANGNLYVRIATEGATQWSYLGYFKGPAGADGTSPTITFSNRTSEETATSLRYYYNMYSNGLLVGKLYDGDKCEINTSNYHWYINGKDTNIVARGGGAANNGNLYFKVNTVLQNTFSADSATNKTIDFTNGNGISLSYGNNDLLSISADEAFVYSNVINYEDNGDFIITPNSEAWNRKKPDYDDCVSFIQISPYIEDNPLYVRCSIRTYLDIKDSTGNSLLWKDLISDSVAYDVANKQLNIIGKGTLSLIDENQHSISTVGFYSIQGNLCNISTTNNVVYYSKKLIIDIDAKILKTDLSTIIPSSKYLNKKITIQLKTSDSLQ